MADLSVVVCGGGVAGAEGLLRLHRLSSGQLRLTLVTPEELLLRPLAVQEPFSSGGARRYSVARLAADTGASWVRDRVTALDRDAQLIRTAGGQELPYDAVLLAMGAHEEPPFERVHVFNGVNADETLHGLVQDIEQGYVNSVAFIIPEGPAWPLPMYELALLTSERARSMGTSPELTILTPEPRALDAFGAGAAEAIQGLFADAGITIRLGAHPRVNAPDIQLGEERLRAGRIVTLPKMSGPQIRGVPTGAGGFFPIDDRCVVRATNGRVFAAGDATDFPIKHGGISTQQADTAAAGIAHLAGLGPPADPLRPVIRGKLLTGAAPLYLSAHVSDGHGWHTEIYASPPWPEDEKVVAEELGPYLHQLDAA